MDSRKAYTIVGIAPKEIQQKFDTLKNKLSLFQSDVKDREEHIILKNTVHFAIKRTFYLKEDVNEENLLKILNDLSFSPLRITCSESGIFEQSNYGTIVFAKVSLDSKLYALYQQIKRLIDNLIETKNPEYEGEGWTPHITFVYNVPQERIPAVKNALDRELLPIEFNLDKIYLLKEYNIEQDERELLKEIIPTLSF